jgi:hypothetical protein
LHVSANLDHGGDVLAVLLDSLIMARERFLVRPRNSTRANQRANNQ